MPPPAIQWKTGTFYMFRATTKVHLGAVSRDIFEDDEVEFDGQICRINGEAFPVPQLRAAYKAGWLVPIDDNVSRYIPKPAGVQVRPAQSAGNDRGAPIPVEHASEDEQVVGSVSATAARRKEAAAGRPARQRPGAAAPAAPAAAVAPSAPAVQVGLREAPPRPDAVMVQTTVEGQKGVILSKADQAAVAEADAVNKARIAAAYENFVPRDASADVEPGTRRDSLDDGAVEAGGFNPQVVQMDGGGQDGEVIASYDFGQGGARVGAAGDKALKEGHNILKINARAVEAQQKPIATTPTFPASSTIVTAGQDILEPGPGGTTGDAEYMVEGDDLSLLLPDAAVAGLPPPQASVAAAPVPPDVSAEMKQKIIAEYLASQQPVPGMAAAAAPAIKAAVAPGEWDSTVHWKKRVAKAVKLKDNPEALAKVIAQETPGVVKHIKTRLGITD